MHIRSAPRGQGYCFLSKGKRAYDRSSVIGASKAWGKEGIRRPEAAKARLASSRSAAGRGHPAAQPSAPPGCSAIPGAPRCALECSRASLFTQKHLLCRRTVAQMTEHPVNLSTITHNSAVTTASAADSRAEATVKAILVLCFLNGLVGCPNNTVNGRLRYGEAWALLRAAKERRTPLTCPALWGS